MTRRDSWLVLVFVPMFAQSFDGEAMK